MPNTTPDVCPGSESALQDDKKNPLDDKENTKIVNKIYCECEDDCDDLWRYIDHRMQEGGIEGEPGAVGADSCQDNNCEETPKLVEDKCCVCGSQENVRRCGNCKLTSYCSKKCQKEHFSHHSQYCSIIVDLVKVETFQRLFGQTGSG